MAFQLQSSAFGGNTRIPKKHTGEGEDVSPPLAWTDPPPGTKELVLVVDDPDAPRPTPWVHWVLYAIPPSTRAIDEGSNAGAVEGPNDFGRRGWGGPMPPPGHGVHHYRFKLFALDAPSGLRAGATKDELVAAMKDHVIGVADLVGTYERPRAARAEQ